MSHHQTPATCICLLALSVPLVAQDENQPPPQEEGRRVLPLSFDAALTLSETNNLGLMLEDVFTEVAHFNARGSWGEFDWVFDAGANYTDFEQNPTSQIQGAEKLEGEQESYSWSFTRPLETGGSFVTSFTSDKTVTNQFDAISPSETRDLLRFSYTQPLLRGFGVEAATAVQRESDVEYLKQVEHRREVLQQLLRTTSDTYWDLVQTRNQLGVAESSLELGRQQLERNQRLLDAGVGTEVEVIQAEAEVARREETRLAADMAMRIAGDALKAELFPGKDPSAWDTVLEPTTELPADVSVEGLESWEAILERALMRRPEIRQQKLEIQIATIRHERSISDRRAGLEFDTGLSSEGRESDWLDAKEGVLDFDTISWNVGLNLNAPIQNRTREYAERAARAQVRAARITFDQIETQIVSEVRDAVRQLHYQSLAVSAAGESLRAARRQLSAEEARYENDLSTNFQVLEFQLQLVEAMNGEQTARANFAKGLRRLRAAEGTLGERP